MDEIKRTAKTLTGELELYGSGDGPLYLTLFVTGERPMQIARFEYWEHRRGHRMFEQLVSFAGQEVAA